MDGAAEFYGLTDPAGGQMFFWVLIAIGLALGVVTYVVGVRVRRVPRAAALVAALLPAVLLVGHAYHNSWARFHGVAVDGQAVGLVYRFPAPAVQLRRADIAEVRQAPTVRDPDACQLIIVTADGASHESVAVSSRRCAQLLLRLRDWRE